MQTHIRTADIPELIRETAKELAGAFYDMNRTPEFRQKAGKQRQFIKMYWKDHVELAYETLSALLGQPGTADPVKEKIYEALIEFSERASQGTPAITTRTLQ